MAQITTPSELIVKIQEVCNLNDVDKGSQHGLKIVNINEINNRIIPIGLTATSIMTLGGKSYGGFVGSDIKYIRISNLDDTNYVDITCNEDTDTATNKVFFSIRLGPGKTFILGGNKFNAQMKFKDNTCDFGVESTTIECDSSDTIRVGQRVQGTFIDDSPITEVRDIVTGTEGTNVTEFTVAPATTNNLGAGVKTNQTLTFTDYDKSIPSDFDINEITGIANNATVDIELYVASS